MYLKSRDSGFHFILLDRTKRAKYRLEANSPCGSQDNLLSAKHSQEPVDVGLAEPHNNSDKFF